MNSWQLGAIWDGRGTRVTVASTVAEGIEVCLFEPDGAERRVELTPAGEDLFSVHLPDLGPGAAYGLRVHGPWEPRRGLRCNPLKLLVDPYARSVTGEIRGNPALFGHDLADPDRPSRIDSASATMRGRVIDPSFDWGDDRPPAIPLADSIIYETHVRGISRLHPGVPKELRGTYAGLGHPAVIEHLTGLGVTALELLPIHQFVQDQHLLDSGRRNYWGYNSIGFLTPHHEYAATADPVSEFKGMVKALHAAGIEVILDVVYNHTAEGNHRGPTLSFRGIDNPGYYRLDPHDRSLYSNWTGTGNALDATQPLALRLVMDSLRYWAAEMHVDGFRFDLAPVLARTSVHYDPHSGFLGAVAQDPVLRGVKLIAEPWDVGPGGYQVGFFPRGWSEWNDQYRDGVRDYWRGAEKALAGFATRLTGSSDYYEARGRRPTASINLVTSHDGFTLADLVSYNERHNEANGENNQDGHRDNRSWNSGVEGPSTHPAVRALRARRQRSLLATLLLSQGVPMILGGDEIGRTQGGNNNAYNQDNEVSWYDWARMDAGLLAFSRRLVSLRKQHPTFRRTSWLHEHPAPGLDRVGWFTPAGKEMTAEDWQMPFARSVALYLDGRDVHAAAGVLEDADFMLLFNSYEEPIEFVIADEIPVDRAPWLLILDTARPEAVEEPVNESVTVAGFALAVLRRQAGG
jgi:glycogen operon protein